MVQNIAIVGLYRKLAYDVAKELAAVLDMHFFDCVELFEFDNIPRDFSTMLREFGEKHYRQKERGMLEYVSGFEETIINLESGMSALKENFKTVKKNCLLIYLHQPLGMVTKRLEKQKYKSSEEQKFFCISREKAEKRIKSLKENCNIMVNASHGSAEKIAQNVMTAMRQFYGIN